MLPAYDSRPKRETKRQFGINVRIKVRGPRKAGWAIPLQDSNYYCESSLILACYIHLCDCPIIRAQENPTEEVGIVRPAGGFTPSWTCSA